MSLKLYCLDLVIAIIETRFMTPNFLSLEPYWVQYYFTIWFWILVKPFISNVTLLICLQLICCQFQTIHYITFGCKWIRKTIRNSIGLSLTCSINHIVPILCFRTKMYVFEFQNRYIQRNSNCIKLVYFRQIPILILILLDHFWTNSNGIMVSGQ